MSNEAALHFTAYKDLKCVICSQPAHGQHFGVVTCRPCAAFFKRCVIEKSAYRCIKATNKCNNKFDSTGKRCKACRLRQCNLVGMKYLPRKNSAGSSPAEEKEEEFMAIVLDKKLPQSSLNLLKKLVAGYNRFLESQKIHFQCTYRNLAFEEIMFVPENLDYIPHFVQSIRPMFYNLFIECLELFSVMDKEKKLTVFNECFAHLNLLNACYLSLRHFPMKNDQKFMIAYGHLMDMDRKWEIFQKWTKRAEILNEQCEFIEKQFYFIQQFKKLGHKIGKEEICALMAIIICKKSPCTREWKEFETKILTELFNFLHRRIKSRKAASKLLAKLLTLLVQIDMFLIKQKNMEIVNNLQMSSFHPKIQRDCNQIKYLTKILNAHRQIIDRCFELPDFYVNKFKSIEEIFDGQENILSLADCNSPYIYPSSIVDQIDTEVIEMGISGMHPKLRKIHIVFHLAVVGFLKAMPIFNELSIKDKEILVRGLGHQINNLTNAYYSVEKGEMSVIGPKSINAFIEVYKVIPRVIDMWKFVFIHPNEAFRRVPMVSSEEFALLMAICFSNSAISGLSSHARELLYKEQCKYSQLLLKYCQHQAGNEVKGAQRYAECLQLIECAFQAVRYFELILTYGEMFLAGKNYFENIPSEYVIKSLMK